MTTRRRVPRTAATFVALLAAAGCHGLGVEATGEGWTQHEGSAFWYAKDGAQVDAHLIPEADGRPVRLHIDEHAFCRFEVVVHAAGAPASTEIGRATDFPDFAAATWNVPVLADVRVEAPAVDPPASTTAASPGPRAPKLPSRWGGVYLWLGSDAAAAGRPPAEGDSVACDLEITTARGVFTCPVRLRVASNAPTASTRAPAAVGKTALSIVLLPYFVVRLFYDLFTGHIPFENC